MDQRDRYLKMRGKRWHYVRRLPVDVAHHFSGNIIQRSLKTDDLAVARLRRDAHEKADDAHWRELRLDGKASDAEQRRYDATILRANALGYDYVPTDELLRSGNVSELLERVEQLSNGKTSRTEVDALLGRVDQPDAYLEDAFRVVCEEVEAEKLARKDEEGRRDWEKQRRATIALFNRLYGTPKLEQINRAMGPKFYNYWKERVLGPTEDGPQITSTMTTNP